MFSKLPCALLATASFLSWGLASSPVKAEGASDSVARSALSAREVPDLPDSPQYLLAFSSELRGRNLADFLDRMESQGVEVPLAISGEGCVVQDSPGARSALFKESVSFRELDTFGAGQAFATEAVRPAGSALAQWAHDVARRAEPAEDLPTTSSPGIATPTSDPVQICAGATTLAEAIQERGGSLRCSPSGESGLVHFASGRFAVNLVFPESMGEASVADWTPALQSQCEAELVRALLWWNLKTNRSATFVLTNRGSASTSYEPGAVRMADEELYLSECMTSLGFSGTCGYAQIGQLNEDARLEFRASWAFTQVILNADNFLEPNVLAYAYLGGPHTVALRGNGRLGTHRLDRVIAHELGHIFQALDEYSGGCGGCTDRSGYLNERNGNCVACGLQTGKCIMRGGSEYDEAEMDEMETRIHPCEFTKGMVGIRDDNGNGILDVRETIPETELITDIPDTLESPGNFVIRGRAWDRPYALAPPKYSPAVTLNIVANVEFSVDGRGWNPAAATDGFWTDREEDFELRLPGVGGGNHRLFVRAMNSILVHDPTVATLDFFVYDVVLLDDPEIYQDGSALVVNWRIQGLDFGSEYFLFRETVGSDDRKLVAQIPSRRGMNDKHRYKDVDVEPAREYVYHLEVEIPDRRRSNLGTVRGKTVLANPPEGKLVSLSPNPTTSGIIITVSVPRGPQAGGVGPPPSDEDNDHGIPPSAGDLRDDSGPPPGSGDAPLQWRDVSLAVFDVSGRRLRDLGTTRQLELTRFNERWDGKDDRGNRVAPGVYYLHTVIHGTARESTPVTVLH